MNTRQEMESDVLMVSEDRRKKGSMTVLNSVAHFFHDTDFPAHRDDLVVIANRGGADHRILECLRRLPDRSFDGPYSINQVLDP